MARLFLSRLILLFLLRLSLAADDALLGFKPQNSGGLAACSLNIQLRNELSRRLSANSTIYSPSDNNWASQNERYMQNVKPQVCLSVHPASEDDVSAIVQFCNQHNIQFYAVSRGHALTTSVGRFAGIEINMSNLRQFHLNPGNNTAHFQGGVFGEEIINGLWEQGYVTATGTCNCVSAIGPALGGGHGLQQGRHGLTSDHLVNLNVVLANGTAVQINENSHPDLWWAFRGAGHNFGIVTSFDSKVWPDNFRNYFTKRYQFGGESLERVVEQMNKFLGNGTLDPAWLVTFGTYSMDPSISQTEATISWVFVYDGPQADAERELQPFDGLGPLSVSKQITTYNKINDITTGSIGGTLCEPNKTHIIGTAGLQTYDVQAMRRIYDLYNHNVRKHPRLHETRVLVEGYSVEGVLKFSPEGSAYPLRDDYILTYFDSRFNTTDDPLIPFAKSWRNETVKLWNAGQMPRKPTAYVNYAAGYESLESRYGYETWRLEKLRELKRIYDPDNKFAWYNPIIPVHSGNREV